MRVPQRTPPRTAHRAPPHRASLRPRRPSSCRTSAECWRSRRARAASGSPRRRLPRWRRSERAWAPLLGVVANLRSRVCPRGGDRPATFLAGGGTRLADELGVPLLGEVPLQAHLADLADTGRPIVAAQPDSPAARALDAIARRVVDALAAVPR